MVEEEELEEEEEEVTRKSICWDKIKRNRFRSERKRKDWEER